MADDHSLFLPPGFRFHPTDEEIIVDYLQQKVADERFSAVAMGEVDLNSCEPWEIPKKAKMGEKMWYFFWQKDRKYPTGTRTNRATNEGYWKATGKDKEIYNYKGSSAGKEIRPVPVLVGMKKTLVFYLGRAPKGERTNWVMHEFRLQGSESHQFASNQEEWVVCRIFHKNELGGIKSKSRMEGGTSREQQQMMMMMMMSMTPAATTSNHQESTSYLFSQMPPPPPPNPNSFWQSGLAAAAAGGWGYLHRQEELANGNASSTSAFTGTGKCKVELQAVSTTNSIRSHSQEDTGINSNDHWHADISSYSSTGEDQYSSAGPLLHNLDNIWEF